MINKKYRVKAQKELTLYFLLKKGLGTEIILLLIPSLYLILYVYRDCI